MNLRENEERLRGILAQLPGKLSSIAEDAAVQAVRTASDLTPPTAGDLRGANTRSGELKQHWITDSRTHPSNRGDDYVSQLNNDKDYASYVNDGHRMDRHFVPGLVINPYSGMLDYDPGGEGGIVVGTKTPYVRGLFMVDKAVQEYRKSVKAGTKGLEEMMG